MPRAAIEDSAGFAHALRSHTDAIMQTGEVPTITKELCAALVAGLNFCTSSLVEHRRRARELGADAATLNDLWDNARSNRYTPGQKAALAAAVALTREPRGLPDVLWAELQQHYTPGQIVEVLCVIGLENYRNRLDNALQI